MDKVITFFRENQQLFYFALSVLALFAEGGRRRYKRKKALKNLFQPQPEPGEENGKSI